MADFQRDQILGAHMAGASVTKTAESFGVTRSTVSKVMTAFEKEGKTSSLKQSSGRKRKLSDRDYLTLMQLVRKNHENTAPKISAELNEHLENPVSSKTVKREKHNSDFTGGQQPENRTFHNPILQNVLSGVKTFRISPEKSERMLFSRTSQPLSYFRRRVEYTRRDSLEKHLIQTVFFQLLNIEEAL